MQLTTDLRAYGFFLSADMGPDQRLRLVVRHFSFAAASHMGTFVTSAKRPLAKSRSGHRADGFIEAHRLRLIGPLLGRGGSLSFCFFSRSPIASVSEVRI